MFPISLQSLQSTTSGTPSLSACAMPPPGGGWKPQHPLSLPFIARDILLINPSSERVELSGEPRLGPQVMLIPSQHLVTPALVPVATAASQGQHTAASSMPTGSMAMPQPRLATAGKVRSLHQEHVTTSQGEAGSPKPQGTGNSISQKAKGILRKPGLPSDQVRASKKQKVGKDHSGDGASYSQPSDAARTSQSSGEHIGAPSSDLEAQMPIVGELRATLPLELQARLRKKIRIIQPISSTWEADALHVEEPSQTAAVTPDAAACGKHISMPPSSGMMDHGPAAHAGKKHTNPMPLPAPPAAARMPPLPQHAGAKPLSPGGASQSSNMGHDAVPVVPPCMANAPAPQCCRTQAKVHAGAGLCRGGPGQDNSSSQHVLRASQQVGTAAAPSQRPAETAGAAGAALAPAALPLTNVQGQLAMLYQWYMINKSAYLEQAKSYLNTLEQYQRSAAPQTAAVAAADVGAVCRALEKAVQIMRASSNVQHQNFPLNTRSPADAKRAPGKTTCSNAKAAVFPPDLALMVAHGGGGSGGM
eukprot:CAMPEP_0202891776 /NCGR_PEP_ID=MMETSP1392-20130828/1752_1 /ASSEMBLY_ACC=CAM_ASM_000868 /TAXON_ID=225041 /ORGANISM="Chlamydomonas chlamydogama, Strain SAG 11-48b" /LENGTH=531 /DNA_ID=CAMNT_0049575629 /DNA_START=225 /DNA_END=1820 /DNA_ORIENTATION=-